MKNCSLIALPYVTGNYSFHPTQQIWFFIMNRVLHEYTYYYIHIYTWVVWLLFWNTVATHTSGLGSKWNLGQSWDGCEWLQSSVVLNKDICCKLLFILKTWMAHNLVECNPTAFSYNFLKPPSCLPSPPPTHVGTCVIQSTLSKNYLECPETWLV